MKEIQVGLAERSYPIRIQEGVLTAIGPDLKDRCIAKRYVVVADSRVAEIYGSELLSSLQGAGLAADLITFPQGEKSKNMTTIAQLASSLARLGVDRKDCLIALGGGVTGDITGFLAAIYMRGIPFIQIPTTLLAQVDSSVGGKTGVDIPEGKNLVGVFYQPRCVFIDTRVLITLLPAELLNGLAEVIKYSIIYDRDFFSFLKEHRDPILTLDLAILEEVIHTCCSIKARVVEADEREGDLRRILNFGHTLGHAVEGASNYTLAHGLAVATGMAAACEMARLKGLLAPDEADEVRDLIASFGLPTTIPPELDRNIIKQYLKTDKKAVSGRPFFVFPTTIGKIIITNEVSEDLIDAVINKETPSLGDPKRVIDAIEESI